MNWKRYLASLGALLFTASAAPQTNYTPIFQFAVFYNSLLEFTWCAPMTLNGRVHANGDIYTGSAWQLTFNSLVTKTGTVSSPAWDGHQTSDYSVATIFNAGYSSNSLTLPLPVGTNSAREIINLPPDGEDPNSALGQQRYYNKANLVLLVSNSTVTLTLKSTPADPQATSITACYFPTNSSPTNYVQINTNFPFLNITNFFGTGGLTTNGFTDQREQALVKATDINMGVLKLWLTTNTSALAKFPNSAGVYAISNAPGILYAADNRTYTNGQLTAIRLKNAQTIPTNMVTVAGNNQPSGFTVATPNPLYVWGNYNVPNSAYLATTNTTTAYPASLVSDALTLLSGAWLDSQSAIALGSSKNKATTTTVNAAILTGNVPSTGSSSTTFSGGVMNLPRLLEDWGSGGAVCLWLNTSLVNLFASTRATNQWRSSGSYYQAPTRLFNFDLKYLDTIKVPPGTPLFGPTNPVPVIPVITVLPQNQTVIAGQTAVFSALATGFTGPAYQWLLNGSHIPGANSDTLTITNASAINGGLYSVDVMYCGGNGYMLSSNAMLTVLYPPAISWGPASQATLTGSNVTFSVSAGGTAPLSYQWRFNGSAIAGGTNSSLVVSGVQLTDAGSYSVSVSNALGSVNSQAASLTVWVAPAISAAPQSLTLLAGQDAVFNAGATGTAPLAYQWQFNGRNLVDATNATLSLKNVATSQAGVYGVTVTNLFGTASTSATLAIYGSPAAVLTAPPCFTGDGFQLTITGVPGFNYAVEASTNLVDWVPLCTNTSPFTFVDSDATNCPVRYYRSVYLP